jgi:hypothetical protein
MQEKKTAYVILGIDLKACLRVNISLFWLPVSFRDFAKSLPLPLYQLLPAECQKLLNWQARWRHCSLFQKVEATVTHPLLVAIPLRSYFCPLMNEDLS